MATLAVDASLFNTEDNTLDDPGFDVINHALDELDRAKPRYDMLFNYYNGQQAIGNRVLRSAQAKNAKVMVNHAKYITDMNVGFMTGNPIKYVPAKGKNIDPILEEMDGMGIQKHDTELEKDLSVFGVGYEVLYLEQKAESTEDVENEGQPRLIQIKAECIDPRGVIMVTDDTVEHKPLFAIYAQEKHNLAGSPNGWLVVVYTKTQTITYRTRMSKHVDAASVKTVQPNYFGNVPVIEYRNNEERQGDFEQEISLIDAYNTIQSDRIVDKESFVDALLIFYGFGVDEEDAAQIKNGFINNAPSKDEGASAEWLTKTLDESQLELLSKSIEDDIHKTSFVPNMNDEKFMGNTSGEAMKYKLFGLLNLLATKSRYFVEGLRKRLDLMQSILNFGASQCDASGCDIKITPNIPANLSETVQNIVQADSHIPREITYSWLPDIDDPKEVIELMNQQNFESIKRQQSAMLQGNPDYIEGQGGGAEENDQSENEEE